MARVYNFSAGPAALPESVLHEVQDELMDFNGTGMSILEISHRSNAFSEVIEDTKETLRRLLNIPDNYHILFLQGGATLQFAGIPMNLMRTGHAGYVISGNFSRLAWQEATKYGEAEALATSEDSNFDRIPNLDNIEQRCAQDDLDYVYICQNNTIFGTMYHKLPQTGAIPLVADVSSCFLSFPLDIERYGLIYAGAQKNAGAAGITVVIIRDDLVGDVPALSTCPSYMSYRRQVDGNSMMNTPNTFGIYLCGKVFRWVEQTGGLEAMRKRNERKAQTLYDVLDHSSIFHATAAPQSRSIANITFRTNSAELDAAFIAGAHERGIEGVKGHRLVGGMRASVYNAVSQDAVDALASYIKAFESDHARSC